MASSEDSDDSAEDGPEYNAILQPPLIKQLKKILDEYPDDGQILKEIIQNAEDAEASQMKILFDERPVNTDLDDGVKEKKFKKYFKGPALCVYNNANFTKEDWQGIQMINSSVKEYDPVKIGRFGLGFKSVFHITDYPMIISGNRMLVLDPHQKNANHVCINMKLNKLHKYKKQLDISYCLNALDGLFNFSQETLDSGEFNGTLFRFPLRDVKTNLSDNVYDIAKISDLFNAFKAEASVELLFLNCIEKIELYDKDGYKLHKSDEPPFFTVKISESCLDDVRLKRSEFHTHMQSVGRNIADQTFSTKVDVKIETQSGSGNKSEQSWFVLHCLKGGNLSQELATLSLDIALSNSPYVSIAVPKDMDTDFKGHVFCLMPLPLEDESLTGYPVHVNGHFALSQNRRHVKWPTADQVRNKAHIDKSIRWNNCLLVEVLAGVYHDVIQNLLQTCKDNGNRKEDLDRFYRSIPDHRKITSHWDLICEPFFQTFLQTACLFSDSFGGKWIHPKDAVFKIFDTNVSEVTQENICRLMQACCIELVDVPNHIVAVLRHRKYSIQTLSQEFIRTCMTSDTSYKSFSCEEKFNILNFLVSDGNYSRLSGLELLPLENGSFCTFYNNKNNRVFICKDEVALFPGQEERFIKQDLNDEVYNHLYMMASKGLYQVVILQNQSASEIASLLQTTITKYIGSTSNREIQWQSSAPVRMDWLEKVWSYIQRYDLSYFSNLHLMPDIRSNEMYKVCAGFILKTKGHNGIPSSVCDCLRYLDIIVLEQIPSIIEEHKNIRNFVYLPTKEDVFRMLIKIQAGGNVNHLVKKFNTTITAEERSQFATYISGYSITDNQLINLLSAMNLFTEKNSHRHVSASQVKIIAETDQLPVLYFKETLDCSDQKYRDLASKLHAKTITKENVIVDILNNLNDHYHTAEINKMMEYVLNNLPYFHMKDKMIRIAREIPFVVTSGRQMKKASDLFDPEDDTLKMIILDNDRFPNVHNLPVELKLLRKLGLKSLQDITGEDILSCARYLHTSNRCTENKRSEELLKVLVNKSGLLSSFVSGRKLSDHLSNLRFIRPSERKDNFPKSLPWYTDTADSFFCRPCDLSSPKFTNNIGSVNPVVSSSSSSLIASVGWIREPVVTDVIDQLLIVTEKYEDKYKPELLPVISDIYHFMANHYNSQDFQRLSNKKWIWTGTGFEEPKKVYLQTKSSDLVLRPYLYPLPDEFRGSHLLQFFRKIRCLERQNTNLLIKVEKMIQTEYCGGGKSEERAKADLQLVVNILNSIKDEKNVEGVLLPIKQDDETLLILKPASECNYCKDDDELFGDEQCFVHHDVSPETAEKLGVPSVTDTLLEDAERLDEWGQSEPLTRRIKNLLESYKDGLSVPKEIIQNADDAGATKVCFMYDERGKENYGKKLLDKNMLECQGPSLWAYNNATFTNADLLSITKVSGATKEVDTTKIGKFGLGFCSVYNLTEVPSFITGDQMVIFDPHYDYLADALKRKKQPGLKIDLNKNRKILIRKHSQFEPFNGVFGCNLNDTQKEITFKGTLFRLPLRTRQQAVSSEISNIPYDNEQMLSLMKIFVEAAGNLLMFTQNVVEVEFFHLPMNEKDPRLAVKLHSVRKDLVRTIGRPLHQAQSLETFSILKDMTLQFENLKKSKTKKNTSINIDFTILIRVSVEANNKLLDFKITNCSSTTLWVVTWASGTRTSKDLALKASAKGVLPIASVASPITKVEEGMYRTCSLEDLPFGFYRNSHVFCYLPLPVETDFPVHINGSFAVTSDRRRLSCKTLDDKDSFDSDWNEALMSDAVCNAYILFLENLIHLGIDDNEPYFKQWPVQYGKDGNFGKLQTAFYQQITDKQRNAKVFRRDDNITSIKNCLFLDSALMEAKFSEEAFSVCVKFLENKNTKMMKISKEIRNSFKDAGCENMVKQKTLNDIAFYSKLVFTHLRDHVWSDNVMDTLMSHAIDHASDKMCNLLKENKCIPTAPNRLLRHPSELVNRKGLLNGLFKEEDERFVILDDTNTYSRPNRLATLVRLGMTSNKLSESLLIDRAKSIQNLAATCAHCALDRCVQFVRYLNKEIDSIESNQILLSELKSIQFLPVRNKSKDWEWSWGGDCIMKKTKDNKIPYSCNNINHTQHVSVYFECPQRLYSSTVLELVCSIHPVMDRNCLPRDIYSPFFGKLGIRNDVPLLLSLENLLVISNDVCQNDKCLADSQIVTTTVAAIYKFLNEVFVKQMHSDDKTDSLKSTTERFRNESILLLNGIFVKPCRVVVQIPEDCSPHFYGLNSAYNLKALKGLLKLLQIDDRCSATQVLSELETYKTTYNSKEMNEDDVKLYVRLLKVLVSSMKFDDWKADKVKGVFIPDINGILHPIQNVCLDESTVKSTETMHFTHDSISYDIAIALGINTKRQHKVDECSKDLYSKEFGQHEELLTKITRILEWYPFGVGILKELLQNADDANASEVHIVLDFNDYQTDNLFDEMWTPLQGPALLVYNDSYFKEADVKGIQNLGIGSKADDSTKTGQYGVGFNAVYHLTDVPSFLSRGREVETGEVLCVFDPHCNYVPGASVRNPGRKYVKTDMLKEDHPNVFCCYHDDLLMTDQGTIFRFPLRTDKFAKKSKISTCIVTEIAVRNLVENFKKEMMEMLLFVNNVKGIKLSEISGGKLKEIYSVELHMSPTDDSKRKEFDNAIKVASKTIYETKNLDSISSTEIKYQAQVKDNCGKVTNWLIVRRVGFPKGEKCPEVIRKAYQKGDLGLLPRGGVALPIHEKDEEHSMENGRVFCFLPLPLESGLPFHFNGHFALDHDNRRNLYTDDQEGYQIVWNNHLLENIIAPSYATSLLEMKESLGLQTDSPVKKAELQKKLSLFYGYFPDIGKAKIDYFKFLVCSIYQWIYTSEMAVFASAKMISKSKAHINFYPLCSSNMTYPSVFNTIKKQISPTAVETVGSVSSKISKTVDSLNNEIRKKKDDQHHTLVHIFKELGIKLLDVPKQVLRSIKEAKLEACEMNPDFLMSFLKSHNTSGIDKCTLGGVNCIIEETTFKTISHLEICISYCKNSKTFGQQLDGLPLCLTEDGIIRTFKRESPVFCTKHSRVLEESANVFLHTDLIELFSIAHEGLTEFDLESFAEFLPATLDPAIYRTQNIPVKRNANHDSVVNMTWLSKVWDFINDKISQKFDLSVLVDSLCNADVDSILKVMHPVMPWCLIPCTRAVKPFVDDGLESVLFPVAKIRYILDLSTFSCSIEKALKQLQLPCLDQSFKVNRFIPKALLVSNNDPCALIKFLYEYRDEIRNRNITPDECSCILEYFSEHIDSISENVNAEALLSKLKQVPLHVNVNGHNISLDSNASVLVLDNHVSSEMVLCGVEEWAEASGTILLKTTHHLTKIYAEIGYTAEKLDAIDVYTNHLLPKFNCLPKENHLEHLVFIREKLLARSSSFTLKQEHLIAVLKNASFVPDIDDVLYKASHFKDPFNDLMKEMCDLHDFPKMPFNDKAWQHFLVIAGIQTKVTSQMVLQFAMSIEEDGKKAITEEISCKSKMLTKHILLRTNIENDILNDISHIKFIVPYTVENWKNKIFPQKTDFLICYRESVSSFRAHLCWTTCNIIPDWANPYLNNNCQQKSVIFSQLGILNEPPFKRVISHVQNVCGELKVLSEKNSIQDADFVGIKNMMIKIYDWLNENQDKDIDLLKKSLYHTPLIFIYERKMLVTCERTVKSLDKKREKEIVPYLLETPEDYGKYFKLFQIIGMSSTTDVCTYVRVLAHLKLDVKDQKLDPNRLKIVKRSIEEILFFPAKGDENVRNALEKMETLYLLTRKGTLINASELVFSDNEDFEEKIGNDIGKPYMMGLDELDVLTQGNIVSSFKQLPKKMQPCILSDMITSEINEGTFTKVNDRRGQLLREFFASVQFQEAIVRIYVHCRKDSSADVGKEEDDIKVMINGLESIKIVQVESIKRKLTYKDKTVGQDQIEVYCKAQDNYGHHTLFCAFYDHTVQQWLIESFTMVGDALSQCTKKLFCDNKGFLMTVLSCIEKPNGISKALDKVGVKQYSISKKSKKSAFPPAGVTVHEEWHCFLDNSFSDFDVEDYVALLLSEEQMEGDRFIPAVYIYAIIVEKLENGATIPIIGNILQYYLVDVGNGRKEEKRAYDCFKFNCSIPEKSNELVVFLDISETQKDERPFDDILKDVKEQIKAAWTLPEDERKKIIKRLFKKWHPDKNHGNETIATEVFKFIKNVVLKMENGENVDTNTNSNFKQPPRNSTFWEHFRTWEHDTSEDRNHGEQRSQSSDSSSFGPRTGRQQHRQEVPSAAEARQWMRQAKLDFTAAKRFFPNAETGPHFNWICIMCYQSVEKVLKGLHFNKDCNNVPSTNDLLHLSASLDQSIKEMVKTLVDVIGPRERTMYPDRMDIPKVPADAFNEQTAKTAVDITEEILELSTAQL